MPDYDDNGSSNEQSIVEIPQQQQHSSLRQSRQWTFQNALKWVHPLHVQYHDHQSSSSGGASTLAALVPVHHCLLQTALQVSTECRDSSAADLAMKLGEESNNTHQYHAQFNSTNTINDAERLLWVQYRLATAVAARRKGISSLPSPVGTETSSSHDTLLLVPEELLVAQVLPLLFPGRPNPSTGSHPEATIDNKNKEEPKWTGASDELLDAMLDALWLFRDPHCEESSKAYRIIDESTRNIQSNTSSDDDDGARKMTVVSLRNDDGARKKTLVSLRLHWLTKCVDFIVTGLTTAAPSLSSSSSRRTWSMSCRILVQLSRWMDNNDGKIGNNTEEKEHLVAAAGAVVVIRQALVELVRWGIHLALASPTTSTSTATTQLATEFLPLEEDFNPSPDSNCNECFSIRDGEDDALDIPAILGPLVRDVLPALLSKSNECLMPTGNGNDMMPFVYDVWGIVWAAYFTSLTSEENNKLLFLQSKATTGLTCLTTILCSIVPSLLDRKLPLVTATTSKNDMIENGADTENKATRVLPLHNEPLWTVIQHCLNQGLTIHFDSIRKRRSCPNQSSTDPLSIDDALETAAVSSSLQMDQLCRRRGMYLLRLLVSQYSMETTATAQSNTSSVTPVQDWFKFVDCFETVEMEQEQHLIDQLWATITELFESMSHTSGQEKETAAAHTNQLPRLSWDWMKLLLGRMLVSQNSPVLRKLCLYRLLQGQAGISIASDLTPANNDENTINSTSENSTMPIRKSKFRSKHSKEVAIVMPQRCGVSLDVVTVEFLFTVIIPSFDTLCTSVGTNMQGSEAMLAGIKKQKGGNESSSKVAICYDMVQLLCDFICVYLSRSIKEAEIQRDTSNVEEFFRRLWSVDVVDGIHDKYTVHIFEAIGQMLEKRKQQGKQSECIPVHDEMLKDVAESFRLSFSDGSVVQVYQTALLQALATMLECSTTLGQYSPQSVLGILALYPVSHLEKSTMAHRGPLTEKNEADTPSWIDADSALSSLRTWLTATNVSITSSGTVNVGAVLGTAFVDGTLMSSMTTLENSNWHPRRGCTQLECKMAKAIGLFCTLPHFVASDKSTTTAGALLWPAIYKGLSNAPGAMIGSSWSRADKVSRSLLLLENGVKLRVLSGMGNGDLVVDKVTKQMMPPPPNIEAILTNGVSFIIHHMRSLVELPTAADRVGAVLTSRGSRSDDARLLSSTFAYLVEQLHSLATGFMSSMAVSEAIEVLLQNNVSTLLDGNKNNDANTMPLIALIFAALSCGGEIPSSITLSVSTIILQSHFDRALQANGSLQASRSVFQYVKWGAISCLVPTLCQLSQTEENRIELQGFMRDLFDVAVESVEATPANTIVPVFASVISAAHACLLVNPPIIVEEQPIPKVVSALFGLLDACDNSNDAMHMMDDMCSLLFQPTLLLNEYTRLEQHPECETPIRDSFRRLVAMAGTQRPHIYRVVLSHICAGWLSGNDPGLTSIPYRDDIADLLVLKEDLIPVASAFMEVGQQQSSFTKKRETHETSIAREFILVFLSKLPHENSGLAPKVLHELLHPVMKQLMQLVTRPPPSGATLIMLGVSRQQQQEDIWTRRLSLSLTHTGISF